MITVLELFFKKRYLKKNTQKNILSKLAFENQIFLGLARLFRLLLQVNECHSRWEDSMGVHRIALTKAVLAGKVSIGGQYMITEGN